MDTQGHPTESDLQGADVLLKHIAAQTVIAEKAYDAQARVVEPAVQVARPWSFRRLSAETTRLSSPP